MNGTEKQIAWANDILENAIEQYRDARPAVEERINEKLASIQQRLDSGETGLRRATPEMLEKHQQLLTVLDQYEVRLRSIDDAGDIIDIKEQLAINPNRPAADQIDNVERVTKAMAGWREMRRALKPGAFPTLANTVA